MRMSFMTFSLLLWEPQSISGTLSLRKNHLVLPWIRGADETIWWTGRAAWSFSSLQSHSNLSGSSFVVVKVKGILQCLFLMGGLCTSVALVKMTSPSRGVALWSFDLRSLSGLPQSTPIQDERVYQCRARRPQRRLISSAPLETCGKLPYGIPATANDFICVYLCMSLSAPRKHTLWVQGTLNQAENTCKDLK